MINAILRVAQHADRVVDCVVERHVRVRRRSDGRERNDIAQLIARRRVLRGLEQPPLAVPRERRPRALHWRACWRFPALPCRLK